VSAPEAGAATPRPNTPAGEPMPGLGTTIPAGAPPPDEALGVPVDERRAPPA
jgi:hypothetical protein